MSERPQAPRGTFDVLPEESAARARLLEVASGVMERAGYGRIETPAFEDTDLFSRGVGESTDIVEKEMFSFEDLGGRTITLRPEGTAPICRAYVQHGMHKLAQPVKLWYWGPFFRYEAPQAGRFRQFTQVGLEALGSDSPLLDTEAIIALDEVLRGIGVPGLRLKLGSLGSAELRERYRAELQSYLRQHESELSADVRRRIESNPLRAFDAKDPGTSAVLAEAPKLLDRLEGDDADHFAEVRALVGEAGVEFELDPTLVRGLDYYTRTVFAFEAEGLGAQSEVGGGGRYDGLVERLGGPATPAVGWAAGIERILLAIGVQPEQAGIEVFVAAGGEADRPRALALVNQLRRSGLAADLDLAGRSLKGQLKQADRRGAARTLIIEGDGPAQLRDMASGEQSAVELSEALERLAKE